ncbi:kinesin-like protein KIF14 [Bombina bombina]|uniref:kinesin-like protein KIF14 n=1 Tax=Bombina bombina TaxID=8345 RepID=UPI00235ACA7A|nr:kinesin-like protein KIF14 [Bombina bombina]
MSFYPLQSKFNPGFYGTPALARENLLKPNGASRVPGNPLRRQLLVPTEVEMSQKGPFSNKMKELNRTYVISAIKNVSASPVTRPDGKLKLQRRETVNKGSPSLENLQEEKNNQQVDKEKRLTLQRRLRTGSLEKINPEKTAEVGIKPNNQTEQEEIKTSSLKSNGQIVRSDESCEVTQCKNAKSEIKEKILENGKPLHLKSENNGTRSLNKQEVRGSEDISRSPVVKATTKGSDKSICGRKVGPDVKTPTTKNGSLDRQKTPKSGVSGILRSSSIRDIKSPMLTQKRSTEIFPNAQRKVPGTVRSLFVVQGEKVQENKSSLSSILPAKDETVSLHPNPDYPLKEENCAVTVAVRVRPFNNRERNENTAQVVFMNGQETSVHLDTKQNHTFLYDFSFWSFEKLSPGFAGQQFVYEKLAVPLLEWSLLGYNTCLFAYGQTGSGKSYTMMGFDEEPGIIPRFCADLFSRIQKTNKQQVHLEMSYFEIYNEKIHDLLVFSADAGQKKQPLRVREHPLLGPYVEDLSANVVSSFQDIQSWLELGNKQRATAATGMNDKSSRSHSVFTLIMTQTTTEYLEGEEHDHRITSRINLVDLAGSERCSSAQTSGDRLKEGVSINKSLLTLGKVISALSENSQARKKIFIPYRESVLTWLLKDSLGGNSKTAMIATVSPAATNIEETLSTLRYAKQARLIINIAKVNEDMNAKLIRELKSEIEKLKAAQFSAKNTDSEKYRHCQQEISSLKCKLSQQEREMSELQRIWKEKLEKAEQRKKEETKELQKAGITFKMDNRLPNLVNLNEDPQLSEMLLYMIKEGQTTVGKYRAGSEHEIQLSGALIAEDHCVITNIDNTVSIMPSGDAKTYVNGNQIAKSTILHHGDRVILGGDHYFRFNHPVEVQMLRTPSRVSTLSPEGPKDFEFAKNELLAAQRAELENEIEEARVRAKEEMMEEIEMAKEMAQKELTSQRSVYEDKIRALEAQLKEESRRKQLQEMSSQKATSKILELEEVKLHLQQEVHLNKRRMEMETMTKKQALEDNEIRYAKILQALEEEKQKIAQEVQNLQQERNNRNRNTAVNPTWNSMKLSVMIQEANTISSKLKKDTTFCRHDVTDKENVLGNPVQIQVRNLKLGIVTFWSLEKFEYKLAAMKELYENNGNAKDEDVFYDPADEWEPDLSNSSVSSFSRRRSLMKNRRISGCLYEIRVHPIQSLQAGHSSGLMNKSSSFLSKSNSICSNPPESHLPGICKEMIGLSLAYLGRCNADESSTADSLISSVHTVCSGVLALSQAYEQQDKENADVLFSVNRAAQEHSVYLTSAFQQLVMLSKHWLDCFQHGQDATKPADDLRLYIKKLGGYLQLMFQGCSSDIPSMVTEARNKAQQTSEQILQSIAHLSVVTQTALHLPDQDTKDEHGLQESFCRTLTAGLLLGLQSLIDFGVKIAEETQTDVQRCEAHNESLTDLKKNSLVLTAMLRNSLADCKKLDLNRLLGYLDARTTCNLSRDLHNLKCCMTHLKLHLIPVLKGSGTDITPLHTLLNNIVTSASHINQIFLSLSPNIFILRELKPLAESLTMSISRKGEPGPYPNTGHVLTQDIRQLCALSPTFIQWV